MASPTPKHHKSISVHLGSWARRRRSPWTNSRIGSWARLAARWMPARPPGNKPELLVVPFVALASAPVEPTPGPEMTAVFWAPLAALPPAQGKTLVPTILGELLVPSFTHREWLIWGFTYRVLEELLVFVGLSA